MERQQGNREQKYNAFDGLRRIHHFYCGGGWNLFNNHQSPFATATLQRHTLVEVHRSRAEVGKACQGVHRGSLEAGSQVEVHRAYQEVQMAWVVLRFQQDHLFGGH